MELNMKGIYVHFIFKQLISFMHTLIFIRKYATETLTCEWFVVFLACIICGIMDLLWAFSIGKKSSTRFATGDRTFIISLLCTIYDGLNCDCWSGALLWDGSWYPHLLCICWAWDAMGSVSVNLYALVMKRIPLVLCCR